MIDLNEMAQAAREVAKERAIESVDTLTLLKHCASEVVEAAEAYKLVDMSEYVKNRIVKKYAPSGDVAETAQSFVTSFHARFAGEVADVVMCALIIAAKEDIDIEEELRKCLAKNKARAEGK